MKHETIAITGIEGSRNARVLAGLQKKGRQSLVIVSSAKRAAALAEDLSFFCDRPIYALPEQEQVFFTYQARNNDFALAKLKALKMLRTDPETVLIVPSGVAVRRMPPHAVYTEDNFTLRIDEEMEPEELKKRLVDLGYMREEMVSFPGQFAARGGIVDVFPVDGEEPCRIEFFGTSVDSIRYFDPETQRSTANAKELALWPAREMRAASSTLIRGLENLTAAYERQIARLKELETDSHTGFERSAETNAASGYGISTEADSLIKELGKRDTLPSVRLKGRLAELTSFVRDLDHVDSLTNYLPYFYAEKDLEHIWDYMLAGDVYLEDPVRIEEHLDLLHKEGMRDLEVLLKEGKAAPEDAFSVPAPTDLYALTESRRTFFLMPFEMHAFDMRTYDRHIDIPSRPVMRFGGRMDLLQAELAGRLSAGYDLTLVASSAQRRELLSGFLKEREMDGKVSVVQGHLSAGMEFPKEKVCFISDADIFDSTKKKRRRAASKKEAITDFQELVRGDYVVHENYGIGKFLGVEPLTIQGETRDYIKIKYAGTDILFVPVDQMDMVRKYIGSDGAPRINSLSGDGWQKTRARAKAAIEDMTEELISLYAKRQTVRGYAFSKDTVWQTEFEDAFPYEETEDQLRAIREIKEDMEKPVPMDRLLCGDVGYGKTEVAARAIFKCLADGKQAAMLVPTTILANQHAATLRERFDGFPFKIGLLSRFVSAREEAETIRGLASGDVDFVIGTHRLLSKDVHFHNLGLLVVDEEQRFGVKNKEKIKEMRTEVDVLTLSATPIPRTLNLSLTGIRDMSLIMEPPGNRYPVQTYVVEQDDLLIREAIQRELDRGGQVFAVYNRVRGLSSLAKHLAEVVPEADIATAHGQMPEHQLEEVMGRFLSGKVNVLVATYIIEAGIDIPQANTMLIFDADKAGLAQLYQLRGRVGRSDRIAYAYLMYRRDKVLSEVASKRLAAIKEFTEFGSGFKVAMRDLEIRGAGNLVGRRQSGHLVQIGYDLYCKLVDQAVRRAKGETVEEENMDITIDLSVPAGIPKWYISSDAIKLDLYRRIASLRTKEDREDVTDELLDRFGDLPKETWNLITVSYIRALALRLFVLKISETEKYATISFGAERPPSAFSLVAATEKLGRRLLIHGGAEVSLRITSAEKERLHFIEQVLEAMTDALPSK